MGAKKPWTPKSRVRNALRQLWLRSRERQACIKECDNTCVNCNRKGSVAKGREVKIQVHHVEPIIWEQVVELVYENLLNKEQVCLCEKCHKEHHETYGLTGVKSWDGSKKKTSQ